MSNQFVGEIRMFGGNFPPAGWALCQGQLLSIATYTVLFQLIGTTYGGDGIDTFALPNLCGRVPIGVGTSYPIGSMAGVESVTLTTAQIPAHTHSWNVVGSASSADTAKLSGGYFANGPLLSYDSNPSPTTTNLAATTIATTGGSQPHENMAPFLTVNFIIALQGVFPSPT